MISIVKTKQPSKEANYRNPAECSLDLPELPMLVWATCGSAGTLVEESLAEQHYQRRRRGYRGPGVFFFSYPSISLLDSYLLSHGNLLN